MLKVSPSMETFSPASARRRKRSVSRARWYGRSSAIPFQSVTTAGEDTPMPSTKRPGAMAARVAALMASRAGPRV